VNGPHAIRQRLLAKFMVVAAERLGKLEHALGALERGEADAELIADAMREIHTLKGESKMMGFETASEAAHRTEDVLLYAKQRSFESSDGSLRLVTDGLDLIRALIEGLHSGPDARDRLASFSATVAAHVTDSRAANPAPDSEAHGTLVSPRSGAPAAPTGNQRLSEAPTAPPSISERAASTEAPDEGDAPPRTGPAPSGGPPPDSEAPAQTPRRARDAPSSRSATGAVVRIDVARIDATSQIVAELSLAERRQEALHARLRSLHERLATRHLGGAPNAAHDGSETPPPGGANGVEALARELGSLAGSWRDTLFELRTELDALGSQLDEMRLLPLNTLLDRFPAAIRALARER